MILPLEKYNQLVEKIVEAVPQIKTTWLAHTCGRIPCPDGGCEKIEHVEMRPIQLADVMRAINSLGDTKKTYAISQEGKFFSVRYIPALLDYEVEYYSKWDLSLPLDQQNDEVKEFLYNLLVK